MYADISFQNIKLKSASCFDDLESTPFMIKFDSTNRSDEIGFGGVCFHLQDAELARALVEAFNRVLRAHYAEPAAVSEPEIAA